MKIKIQNIIRATINTDYRFVGMYFLTVVFSQNKEYYKIDFPYSSRKSAKIAIKCLYNHTKMPKPDYKPVIYSCDRNGKLKASCETATIFSYTDISYIQTDKVLKSIFPYSIRHKQESIYAAYILNFYRHKRTGLIK